MSGNSSLSDVESFGFDSGVGQPTPVYRRKTREELKLDAKTAVRFTSLPGLLAVFRIATQRLLTHWETTALTLIIAFIALSVSAVLWPMPTAEFSLRSLPLITNAEDNGLVPAQSEARPEENAVRSDALAVAATGQTAAHAVKPHWHHTPKKPKHPPIQNLNTAPLAKLQLLPGIGPKMAQRIIEYRKSHGPFTDVSQVMDVKGIGAKKFEKMKPFLKI